MWQRLALPEQAARREARGPPAPPAHMVHMASKGGSCVMPHCALPRLARTCCAFRGWKGDLDGPAPVWRLCDGHAGRFHGGCACGLRVTVFRDCGVGFSGFIETVSGSCFKSKTACDEPVCSRAHTVRDVSGAGEHGLIEPRVVASLTAVVFLDMALRVLSRLVEPGSNQGT